MQIQTTVSGSAKLQMLEKLIQAHTELEKAEKAGATAFDADKVTDEIADDLFNKRALCAAELLTAKAELTDADYSTLLRLAGVARETADFLTDLYAPKTL